MRAEATAAFSLAAAGVTAGGRVLLGPLTLEIAAGRVTALIGHNGSGKSTLMSLLARQRAPSQGSLRCFGQEMVRFGARDFARRVAFLPQDPPALDGLTVRELVALGRYPWHGALGAFSALDRDKVAAALDITGSAPFADRLVASLSGGERQRSWIAMMLAQDADCLLLDEPISALDVGAEAAVMQLLADCACGGGKSVVVVLHDINVAARYCDEIIALAGGRLLDRGTPAELMQAGRLAAIYGLPMGVTTPPDLDRPICYAL